MDHSFTHLELNTTDVPKAKEFYQKLFQWEMQDIPEIDYTIIKTSKQPRGGIFKHPKGGPSHWLPYVDVDDIRVATELAKSLGGKTLRENVEIPGQGWLSIILDPTGACLGLWQNK